jgi:hypothetical protein
MYNAKIPRNKPNPADYSVQLYIHCTVQSLIHIYLWVFSAEILGDSSPTLVNSTNVRGVELKESELALAGGPPGKWGIVEILCLCGVGGGRWGTSGAGQGQA